MAAEIHRDWLPVASPHFLQPKGDLTPREKLRAIGEQLRKLSFPTSPISMELVEFLTGGIESYLSEKHPNVDRALGLTHGPGAPRSKQNAHIKLAAEIWWRRIEGQTSWHDILDGLQKSKNPVLRRYSNSDPRVLRGICKKVFDDPELRAAAIELMSSLRSNDKPGDRAARAMRRV